MMIKVYSLKGFKFSPLSSGVMKWYKKFHELNNRFTEVNCSFLASLQSKRLFFLILAK